jgi:hypothetical protein
MNVNFGLLPTLSEGFRKKAKKEAMARRALLDMETWVRNPKGAESFVPLDADPNAPAAVA